MKHGLLGTWRESAWKLCHPAAQLTAADYDMPLDNVTFQPDGTFTLTWRGGGARADGHPSITDYQGR